MTLFEYITVAVSMVLSLALVRLVSRQMKRGLELLGIETVERM